MSQEQKPDLFKRSSNGTFNLQYSELEVEALIQVLHFARTAAIALAQQEMKNGGGVKTATKMGQLAADSKELIQLTLAQITIGESPSDNVH